ncbi:hypothetical protein [Planobispora rosea]|uniref:hypothetical protein n=1 Tax=Planobispora rosea TaxID=35762 RepID=UPI00114CF2D9|nr:hypothetical protein [Planobispora rosea]
MIETHDRKGGQATRRGLVVLGAHLLVGLLTVGSQALIPTGVIPPNLEMGLRALVAVLLAAGASVLTTVASTRWTVLHSADDEQPARSPRKTFWRRPRFWGFLLSFAVVAIASGYLYRPPSPISFAEPVKVGKGLDIAEYCISSGFNGKSNETCYFTIREEEVCNWQHKREDLILKYTDSKDLESGICVDKKGKSIGKGIKDMQGFCQYKFEDNPSIRYRKNNEAKEWRCEMGIDKNVVCIWQNREPGLIAVKDKDADTWQCYRPRKQ